MMNKKNNVIFFENKNKKCISQKESYNLVSIKEVDWQRGFDAGLLGIAQYPVPTGADEHSWYSGWIEGSAKGHS